ncbi:MAG: hypothetical protein GC181_06825 [Bacteroidetes bacterium]|nr:hypothetical protein [Bacteroidota bacterium]
MKLKLKHLSVLFLLITNLFRLSAQTAGKDQNMGFAYDWEELEDSEQQQIERASEYFLNCLVQQNIKGFWDSCHLHFRLQNPYSSFAQTGNQFAQLVANADSIVFINGKKVDYLWKPNDFKPTTGGIWSEGDDEYIKYLSLPGMQNQALTVYRVYSKNISRNVIMKFGKEGSSYHLGTFEIFNCAIGLKDASYYLQVAEKCSGLKLKMPQYLALQMAYRFSYLGNGTETKALKEISQKISVLAENPSLKSEFDNWKVNDSVFNIITIDFFESPDMVAPNVVYLTKSGIGEFQTNKEADMLMAYLKKTYPELTAAFPKMVFTAYEEYPADPNRQYRNFKVLKAF